jgi:hypothetical protein
MSDFISTTIKNILSNGIALNLETEEEEQHYIIKLHEYFVEETDFAAYLRKDKVLELEALDMQIAMEVTIQHSTLYIIPYTQDIFELFAEILKFISSNHLKILQEFRGLEETRIETPSEIGKKVENEKIEKIEPEEESSDDDDLEWI